MWFLRIESVVRLAHFSLLWPLKYFAVKVFIQTGSRSKQIMATTTTASSVGIISNPYSQYLDEGSGQARATGAVSELSPWLARIS